MRLILSIVSAALISLPCFANMASPVHQGTLASSPITSSDIDILKETIRITPDPEFQTALFEIEYSVSTGKKGMQIPLLFYAADYKDGFKIWVDENEVTLLDFPSIYDRTTNSWLENFSHWLNPKSNTGQKTVTIQWDETTGFAYPLSDLKYFEVNLSTGEHKIRVEYSTTVWLDVSGWVNEYSFRYSLMPAKKWKSFGTLEVVLDAAQFESELSTNLGTPASGSLDSTAIWTFQNIPVDLMQITYVPEINPLASKAIALGPNGLTLIAGIALLLLHFTSILLHRRHSSSRYSWVVIVGSFALPFVFLLFDMYSYDFIDSLIGSEAGGYHGYTFMVIIFYPVIMPVYWLVMWMVDRVVKRRILSREIRPQFSLK